MLDQKKMFELVLDADDRLIAEGYAPYQRPLNACGIIADKLGISFIIGEKSDPFVEDVHRIYDQLYRKEDLYMPPVLVGAFMFRDVFFPVRIPVIFGRAAVKPLNFIDGMTDFQKRWLFSRKTDGFTYLDQAIDLFDFAYSLNDAEKLKRLPEKAIEFWQLARQQLEGAAATLLVSFDQYVVIQNSIIASELLMKGALLTIGYTEERLRKIGHNIVSLAEQVATNFSAVDGGLLVDVARRYPGLIERRYEAKEYKRTEIGLILMNTQFIAGEIMRQFSDRNLRAGMTGTSDWDTSRRTFPVRSRKEGG